MYFMLCIAQVSKFGADKELIIFNIWKYKIVSISNMICHATIFCKICNNWQLLVAGLRKDIKQ